MTAVALVGAGVAMSACTNIVDGQAAPDTSQANLTYGPVSPAGTYDEAMESWYTAANKTAERPYEFLLQYIRVNCAAQQHNYWGMTQQEFHDKSEDTYTTTPEFYTLINKVARFRIDNVSVDETLQMLSWIADVNTKGYSAHEGIKPACAAVDYAVSTMPQD